METPSRQAQSSMACDACRLKKLRCSKERPSCSSCLQARRNCHYSGRIIRPPLTRSYLNSVERRLRDIEKLVAERLPGVDLDEALASLGTANHAGSSSDQTPTSNRSPRTDGFSATVISSATENRPSEAVPDEADGFDWYEDVNNLADGMASLAIEPTGAGYLGSTAGVFFLRSLLLWTGNPRAGFSPPNISSYSSRDSDYSTISSQRLSQSLATRQVMGKLLDSYFSVYHQSYPFVHEATLRAQFHEVIPRPQHRSWQMLMHTVLALGAWCLKEERTELEDDLYHLALSVGDESSMFESANLTFVQALVLLSNLSQKRNKPNTGSNLLGLAIRMALSLGLHRELPNWDINLFQREMRRRVWWGLYIFDSGASTTFGRPILLPDRESMDVKYILNIDDECLTPRTVVPPEEYSRPTIYSGMKAQVDFHVCSNHISNRLLTTAGPTPEEAISMNQMLDAWCETLPPYFQLTAQDNHTEQWFLFARCKLWWRFWNLKIILFRQLLLRRAVDQSGQPTARSPNAISDICRFIGVEAAHTTIVSINNLLDKAEITRVISWYSLFFLFHASLIVALAIIADPEAAESSKWQADIVMVRHILRNILVTNMLAARCADILDQILPFDTGNTRPTFSHNFDFTTMDFAVWPAEQVDVLAFLGFPEGGPGI